MRDLSEEEAEVGGGGGGCGRLDDLSMTMAEEGAECWGDWDLGSEGKGEVALDRRAGGQATGSPLLGQTEAEEAAVRW